MTCCRILRVMILYFVTLIIVLISAEDDSKERKYDQKCLRISSSLVKCESVLQQCCDEPQWGNETRCSSYKDGSNITLYINQCHLKQARCRNPEVCILRKGDQFCTNVPLTPCVCSSPTPEPPPCQPIDLPMSPPIDASHNINVSCRRPRKVRYPRQTTQDEDSTSNRMLRRLLGMPTPKPETDEPVCNRTENMPEPPKVSACLKLASAALKL
ncbi:uncharacterized protein [Amphiura filiformis]|uniref:uncharacterized protein n=1 Tax=Amphiura filiformis TaxID=82378 RepID=UPI003B21ECB8